MGDKKREKVGGGISRTKKGEPELTPYPSFSPKETAAACIRIVLKATARPPLDRGGAKREEVAGKEAFLLLHYNFLF